MPKSDFEKIVAQYAEMMATAASIVPECVDLINNYRKNWCCTIKVDIENSKGQYIEKDKQEATKDGSESTKIQHGI